MENPFHKTIKKVSDDIEALKFNTAIAAMMALLNEIIDQKKITRGEMKTILPYKPHLPLICAKKCGRAVVLKVC